MFIAIFFLQNLMLVIYLTRFKNLLLARYTLSCNLLNDNVGLRVLSESFTCAPLYSADHNPLCYHTLGCPLYTDISLQQSSWARFVLIHFPKKSPPYF